MEKEEVIKLIIEVFEKTPGNIIGKEQGYEGEPFVTGSRAYLNPRYGCGLCQTKVPCQDGIPGRA